MKRFIAFVCVLAMTGSFMAPVFAEKNYGTRMENPNLSLPADERTVMHNGTLVLQAEDLIVGKAELGEIVSDANASGGKAVAYVGTSMASNTIDTIPNPYLFSTFIVDSTGTFYVWVRVLIPSTTTAMFCAINSDSYTEKRFSVPEDTSKYYWGLIGTAYIEEGLGTIGFKGRVKDTKIDKIVITTDAAYAPVEIDDMPQESGGDGGLWPLPEITPIAGHPRLLITEEYITGLKARLADPEISSLYKTTQNYADTVIDCKLAPNASGNMNNSLLVRIQARALLYAMGEKDAAHAKETIQHMTDYFDTVFFPAVGDITRQMGETMIAGAIVYDWCYDQMTDANKNYFIRKFAEIAMMKECKYPPIMTNNGQSVLSGHIGEREIMLDLIGAGIACYDESPDMYNLSAGKFFAEMQESRIMFNKTGKHPQGNAYANWRFSCEAAGALLFDRMGYKNVYGAEMETVPYQWIYHRLPIGTLFKEGDDFNWAGNTGYSYILSGYPLGYAIVSAMYDDPYIRQQYLQYRVTNSQYSYNTSLMNIILADPSVEGKFHDELPLSYKTTFPLSSVVARTSWQQGINAPTAMAYMQMREKPNWDHTFMDTGSFQLYYKGSLAIASGYYDAAASPHNYNYSRRTVAHNCMLVYDPNEVFYLNYQDKSTPLEANDGGQKFRYQTADLEEFFNVPDYAKTEGIFMGPNKMTPEFSYGKSDITGAYTEKVKNYKRSMVFMDLFDEDYPAAFIVFDKIDSSNAAFKKSWLLHSIEEPVVNGMTTVIKRTEDGFNGKLVNQTLLPTDAQITKVGGPGKEFWVDGKNYSVTIPEGRKPEQGSWRIEVSPGEARTDDLFLNAMYMTDADRDDLPPLEMTKVQSGGSLLTGVAVRDRLVMFSTDGKSLQGPISLTVPDKGFATVSCMVADLAPGMWKITAPDGTIYNEVLADENVLYFKGSPGAYTLSAAPGQTKTEISYPQMLKQKYGDFMVYDRIRFVYVPYETKMIEGVAYIPIKSVFNQYDTTVDWNSADGTVTVSNQYNNMTIKGGSLEATLNGGPWTLTNVPLIFGGVMYVGPDVYGNFFDSTYYSSGRILAMNFKKTTTRNTNIVVNTTDDNLPYINPARMFLSSSNDDGNLAANATDGNLNTRWAVQGTDDWLLFDFGEEYEISHVEIAFYRGDYRKSIFELEVSTDGQKFTKVFSGNSSGTTNDFEKFEFAPVKARYLRYVGHGSSLDDWNSIVEVMIYKKAA